MVLRGAVTTLLTLRVRSLKEGQTTKTMGEDEYDEFEMLNESCSMMTGTNQEYFDIVPRELELADDIVVDSGSPEHLFKRREDILRLQPFSPGNCFVTMANGQSVECLGQGTRGILRLVYWVPRLSKNLLSVQALAKEGCYITFADNYVYIEPGSSELDFHPFLIRKTNLQYILPMCYLREINAVSCNEYAEQRLYVNMMGRPVSGSVRVLTDPVSIENEMIVDSGCSQHMFNTCRNLINYNEYPDGVKYVSVADGAKVPVAGFGQYGILKKVYHVPALSHCLISVAALTKEGMVVTFRERGVTIEKGTSKLKFRNINGSIVEGMYKVSLLTIELCTMAPHVYCLAHNEIGREYMECNLLSENARLDPISQIHYKFGHPSAVKTRHICKCYNLPGIRKLEIKAFDFLKNCEMCRRAKATRSSFKGTMARAAIRGKFWYADIKGPFEQPSLVHGNKYVFGIIESKTRLLIQFYIKKKSDVEACLRSWYEKHIKALRLSDMKGELTHIFLNTDMGECTSHKIIDYLATIGIELKTTCPHTPEQNMVIERVWRTIGESAIAMMLTSNMSETYWEEARKTACYVYNRSPGAHDETSSISPYEQYYGIVPQVSHLKIFGTKCWALNPTRDKGNHEPKAWPGIFVGYQDQQPKGYRIYLTSTQEFIITAHASFEDNLVRDPFIADEKVENKFPYTNEELVEIGQISDALQRSESGSGGSRLERGASHSVANEDDSKTSRVFLDSHKLDVVMNGGGYGTPERAAENLIRENNLPSVYTDKPYDTIIGTSDGRATRTLVDRATDPPLRATSDKKRVSESPVQSEYKRNKINCMKGQGGNGLGDECTTSKGRESHDKSHYPMDMVPSGKCTNPISCLLPSASQNTLPVQTRPGADSEHTVGRGKGRMELHLDNIIKDGTASKC